MPSAAAESDAQARFASARLRVGQFLADRGVYGLVWLDDKLTVRGRFGSIVDFVEVEAPVTQSVPAVIGLEEDIRALQGMPDHDLRLPNVATVTAQGCGPRLNFFFHRFEAE